jgi:ribose-phosphate pyrophosphokinase
MKLFGLNASAEGAQRVARELGTSLASHEEREFEDGEFKIRPLESVRRARVVVYQSLSGAAGASANDKLVRTLVFVGALRDAGAAAISVLAPYLAYARKDRRTKQRDPITIRYVAQLFESVGVDELITADVHNQAAFENAFRCQTRNVELAPLFVEHFSSLATSSERLVVVSPDAGGVKRARRFAALLSDRTERPVDVAFVEKHRSEGRVTGDLFAGDVRGATVIIIDDLISGGTTMLRSASACLEHGALRVHAAATHGVFTPQAAACLDRPALESVVVTDSVCDVRTRGEPLASKLTVLESAGLLAQAVR